MQIIQNGDLIKGFMDGQVDVIIHGCNCFHIMGGGIARKIALQFPEVLEADKKTPWGDFEKLSNYSVAKSVSGGIIINLYTQFYIVFFNIMLLFPIQTFLPT